MGSSGRDYLGIEWSSSALLVIDFQRDVADDGAHPIPGTSEVAPTVRGPVEAFRRASRPIADVVRLYPPGGTDRLDRSAYAAVAAHRLPSRSL
ncbi:MAG: hypothetical protein ACOYBY_04635 [Dermatophilaceae bacterium]